MTADSGRDRPADRRRRASFRAATTSTWPAPPTSSARPGERCGSASCLACVITYLLMAALFESWLYPFVIILIGAAGGGRRRDRPVALESVYVLQTARRADDARLRDPDRHGGEQPDFDRAPIAQPHARRRHVAERRDRRIGPHPHSADLDDGGDDGVRPVAAGAVSRAPAASSTAAWARCCWAA